MNDQDRFHSPLWCVNYPIELCYSSSCLTHPLSSNYCCCFQCTYLSLKLCGMNEDTVVSWRNSFCTMENARNLEQTIPPVSVPCQAEDSAHPSLQQGSLFPSRFSRCVSPGSMPLQPDAVVDDQAEPTSPPISRNQNDATSNPNAPDASVAPRPVEACAISTLVNDDSSTFHRSLDAPEVVKSPALTVRRRKIVAGSNSFRGSTQLAQNSVSDFSLSRQHVDDFSLTDAESKHTNGMSFSSHVAAIPMHAVASLLFTTQRRSLMGHYFHTWWRCALLARQIGANFRSPESSREAASTDLRKAVSVAQANQLLGRTEIPHLNRPALMSCDSSVNASPFTSPVKRGISTGKCVPSCCAPSSRASSAHRSPGMLLVPFGPTRDQSPAVRGLQRLSIGNLQCSRDFCTGMTRETRSDSGSSGTDQRPPAISVDMLHVYTSILTEEEWGARTTVMREEASERYKIQTLTSEVLDRDFKEALCRRRAVMLRGCPQSDGLRRAKGGGNREACVDRHHLPGRPEGSSERQGCAPLPNSAAAIYVLPEAANAPKSESKDDPLNGLMACTSPPSSHGCNPLTAGPVGNTAGVSHGILPNSCASLASSGAHAENSISICISNCSENTVESGRPHNPSEAPKGDTTEPIREPLGSSKPQKDDTTAADCTEAKKLLDDSLELDLQRYLQLDLVDREREDRLRIVKKYRNGLQQLLNIFFGKKHCRTRPNDTSNQN
ncbi:T. brucei spp.-specific protein [Trypanosoma brucei gambiense DAL972]|uniref:T. brucei spp.-specific protein n=1 Tax=Trypanosoma brucei gambiense (strain MHOM/CI/86/DAL972) TaxID=679716 RepID=C9ZXL7_TRYB9|nr:T. brucei spp.-specific protein [Trypanosoma brucei gambiense DAL972]CBH14161.1 T. brucei spp.-specific protein [Trypanosoma brucei gambiense DAL972]|eukprot:XP_011776432.1 T. brucei spp.-specific protein [Trypanosoma brucei gambiense DAL972]